MNLQYFLVFFSALFLSHVAVADNEPLTIGIDQRVFLSEKDIEGHWKGLDIALVSLILNEAKLPFEFRELPWKRILRDVKQGNIDLALSAAKLPERQIYAYYSTRPFRLGQNMLFGKSSARKYPTQINSLMDLANTDFMIGVVRGSSYSDTFEQLKTQDWFKQKMVTVNDANQLPHLLIKGRTQVYIDSEFAGKQRLMKLNLYDGITPLFRLKSNNNSSTYIMMSKQSVPKNIVTKINEAMAELYQNGKYQKLIDEYNELATPRF